MRHPFSGTCSFCGQGPEHADHMHDGPIADANHALLVGQIFGMLLKEHDNIMSFKEFSAATDTRGNYLDTITIELASGKYDITVRPQQ